MARNETDNLSDSEYFRIADFVKAKSSNKMLRIYKSAKVEKKQKKESSSLWRWLFSFLR